MWSEGLSSREGVGVDRPGCSCAAKDVVKDYVHRPCPLTMSADYVH